MDKSDADTASTWLNRLQDLIQRDPKDKVELLDILRDCVERKILDNDALTMIEGVLQFSQLQVRDSMIARAQMITVECDTPWEQLLPQVIESKHSRFPVIGESRDEVVGILLAKDLLRYTLPGAHTSFVMGDIIHSATFVPESKRLDSLLQEFQHTHSHMAIVIDEYGGISGLITIEDVIEQIVGEIEDEYYVDDNTDNIRQLNDCCYHIKAITPIEQINKHFNVALDDKYFDTLGGLVSQRLGHIPKPGEAIDIDGLGCKVLHADKRRALLFEVKPLTEEYEASESAEESNI